MHNILNDLEWKVSKENMEMWLRNQRKDKKFEEYCLENFEKLNGSYIALNKAKDRN